jgi:hypothetical protein
MLALKSRAFIQSLYLMKIYYVNSNHVVVKNGKLTRELGRRKHRADANAKNSHADDHQHAFFHGCLKALD